jgi:hypothetical protein
MMVTAKLLFVAILLLGLLQAAPASLYAQQDKRIERLTKERLRLQRPDDPVGRTKTQIKIADILVTLIGDAVRNNNLPEMEDLLQNYLEAIQDARDTMMNSGRDAQRKAGGFKDLEIALRRHLRQLQDMGGALTFDQREPVDKARAQATEIRDQLLRALFGGQNV